jgi:hypothetical protein
MGSIKVSAVWFTPNSSTSRINISISGQPTSTDLNVFIGINPVFLDSVRSFTSSDITTFLTTGYYNTNVDQLIVINSTDNNYVLAKVSKTVSPPSTETGTSIAQTWYCDPLYKTCSLKTGTTGYATRDLCYKDALCVSDSGGTGSTNKDKCPDPLKIGCIFGIPITYIAGLGFIAFMIAKKKT